MKERKKKKRRNRQRQRGRMGNSAQGFDQGDKKVEKRKPKYNSKQSIILPWDITLESENLNTILSCDKEISN